MFRIELLRPPSA